MSSRGSISFSRGVSVDTRTSVDSPICMKHQDGTLHDVHCDAVAGEEVTVIPFNEAKDMVGEDTGHSLCTSCLGSDEFLRVIKGDDR